MGRKVFEPSAVHRRVVMNVRHGALVWSCALWFGCVMSSCATLAPARVTASPEVPATCTELLRRERGWYTSDVTLCVLTHHKPKFMKCYKDGLESIPEGPSELRLQLEVGTTGQVKLLDAHFENMGTEEGCFEQVARSMIFPVSSRVPAQVNTAIRFTVDDRLRRSLDRFFEELTERSHELDACHAKAMSQGSASKGTIRAFITARETQGLSFERIEDRVGGMGSCARDVLSAAGANAKLADGRYDVIFRFDRSGGCTDGVRIELHVQGFSKE